MRLRQDANATLIDWLRTATDRPRGRFRTRRRVAPEALRCHPDLLDRLEAIAVRLPGIKTRYIRGVPVLVHPRGAVFALAGGTSWIMLRLPNHVHSAVVRSEWGDRGLDGDWIDIDPWLTDMPARDGLSRLRGWCRAAYAYVGEVGTFRGR